MAKLNQNVLIMVALFVAFVQLSSASSYPHPIPLNGDCTHRPNDCDTGLACVGTATNKKCKEYMSVNEQCNLDPFWVCEPGLICDNNVCKIPIGDSCAANTDGCVSGSICEDGVCKIPRHGECTENPEDCASGLACVGSSTRKTCRRLREMGPNQECNVDPLWVCKVGLTCENNICKIPENAVCEGNTDACASGLSCVGVRGTKLCKKLMPVGGRCDPHWICQTGLVCSNYRCVIPEGGECTNDPTYCISGTNCVGRPNKKICKAPIGPGESCKNDPFWRCVDGFKCIHGECKIPKGGNCRKHIRQCQRGTKCALGYDHRCH